MSGAGTNKTAANGTASKHAHAPSLISAGSGVMSLSLANYYCKRRGTCQLILINYAIETHVRHNTLISSQLSQQLAVLCAYIANTLTSTSSVAYINMPTYKVMNKVNISSHKGQKM